MDIRALIQFLQVAKEGSYTKAAVSLYLVQPTLSKTIQNLESELGVQLFQKNGQHIELTDYGKRLVEIATPIVNQFRKIPEWLKEDAELEAGSINIGVTPMIAELYLASHISDFYHQYPHIKLNLFESTTYAVKEAVLRNECDIGLCMSCTDIRNCRALDVYPLFSEEKEVVAAIHKDNPLCLQDRISMEDLRHEKFNFYAVGHALRDEVYQRCSACGFYPDVNISSSNAVFLLKLTEGGNGITILPKPYVDFHEYPDIRVVSFTPVFPWECCLLMRRNRYQPTAVKRFLEYITAKF